MVQIKCYRPNEAVSSLSIFILSKGSNAGKPLSKPCPNCFVLTAEDENQREKMYWLLYGLWQGGCFYQYLTGSVIPFLRIDDLKNVLGKAYSKTHANPESLMKAVLLLKKLDEHQCIMLEQIRLIKEVKKTVILKTIR